jgi:hypothetical protein
MKDFSNDVLDKILADIKASEKADQMASADAPTYPALDEILKGVHAGRWRYWVPAELIEEGCAELYAAGAAAATLATERKAFAIQLENAEHCWQERTRIQLAAAASHEQAVNELILYAKHWPDCSAAPIACACGLTQLIAKVKRGLK